jgi:hypothetical protein
MLKAVKIINCVFFFLSYEHHGPLRSTLTVVHAVLLLSEIPKHMGLELVLSLDANEDTKEGDSGFYLLDYQEGTFLHAPNHDGSMATLVATCGLIDVLFYFHPPPDPSTYAKGKNRLNYIYMSEDIIHSASRSGILPLYSVFTGDHNACYLDIDATLLFTESTFQIAPPTTLWLTIT